MKNLSLLALIFIFALLGSCSNDWNSNEPVGLSVERITKTSELYKLIQNITAVGNDDPLAEIVCIDFIYPFAILVYNENLEVIDTKILGGDDEFSAFLGSLPDTQSISISYPIETILADGTTFSINDNQELKAAIDACAREDLIGICGDLFGGDPACVWQVPFTLDNDNTYASGVFSAHGDGTVDFYFGNQTYQGTWTFLFVNDEFQMNINLEGTSAVAAYWNFSTILTMTETKIKLFRNGYTIVLEKKCEQTELFSIGQTGTGGGIVFYDKGFYTNGWRYAEVALTDLPIAEWGCATTATGATNSTVGNGFFNSAKILNFHDSLQDYYINPGICTAANNGTVAAKNALLFNNKDWFLPSEQELLLVYQNLHEQNIGNFTVGNYWTSTEVNASTVKAVNFENGNSITAAKIPTTETISRAVRYF